MARSESLELGRGSGPFRPAAIGLSAAAAALLTLASPAFAAAATLFIVVALVAVADLQIAIVVLLLVAPWMTLANVLVGGRWVALAADGLLILVFASLPSLNEGWRPRGSLKWIAASWLAILAVGLAGMANPRGLSLLGDLEGYRAFFLPLLALPIGFVLVRHIPTFERTMLLAIIAAAVCVALMGIRQAISISSIDLDIIQNAKSDFLPFTITGTNRLRAFSPLPGPFHFGLMMMIAITIVGGLALQRARTWHGIVLAILLIALGLNATRLNWAGTLLAIASMFLLSLSRERLLRTLLSLLMLALFGFGAIRLLGDVRGFATLQRFATSFFSNPLENTSYTYRVLSWFTDIIPAIRAAPIFGYGTGMAKDGLGPYSSHNIILKLLIEGGALLLLPYLILLTLIVRALWGRRRVSFSARAGIALILGVHAAGMFGPILDAFPANEYFWLLIGVALGTATLSDDLGQTADETVLI